MTDTVKVLTDSNALEPFRKTLPGAGNSVQIQVSERATKAYALDIIDGLRSHGQRRVQLDFIPKALRWQSRCESSFESDTPVRS